MNIYLVSYLQLPTFYGYSLIYISEMLFKIYENHNKMQKILKWIKWEWGWREGCIFYIFYISRFYFFGMLSVKIYCFEKFFFSTFYPFGISSFEIFFEFSQQFVNIPRRSLQEKRAIFILCWFYSEPFLDDK